MQNEKRISALLFGSDDGCGEDGGEFFGFFGQIGKTVGRENAAFNQKLELVGSFVEFLKGALHLVDEICL